MEIFVSKLPKSCNDCKLGYFYDCQYCFLRPDLAEKDEWCEKEKHCKLLPLSDRLAEERKKVCDEICVAYAKRLSPFIGDKISISTAMERLKEVLDRMDKEG